MLDIAVRSVAWLDGSVIGVMMSEESVCMDGGV